LKLLLLKLVKYGIRVIANALCHTDIYSSNGHDPEGLFPCIWDMKLLQLLKALVKESLQLKSEIPLFHAIRHNVEKENAYSARAKRPTFVQRFVQLKEKE